MRPGTSSSPSGELLAERYRIGEAIGRGRSTVYRAEDTRLQREVAVKEVRLYDGHEDHKRTRRRVMREAHATARLNNPHAVTVFDVVEADESVWLVMELVEAPSLSQLVADDGPVDHARAARIGLAMLDALEAAHAEGVVHRDVKPANVLVDQDDHTKLADFGVATLRDDTRLTATGMVVGSPAYMSPEQARGEPVGPATDLWGLGATLYYAVEGAPPFEGSTALATASAVVYGEPRPARRTGPLTPVVLRLLAKDPARRLTASQLRQELRRAAGAGRRRRGRWLHRRAAPVEPAESRQGSTAIQPAVPAAGAALPTTAPTDRQPSPPDSPAEATPPGAPTTAPTARQATTPEPPVESPAGSAGTAPGEATPPAEATPPGAPTTAPTARQATTPQPPVESPAGPAGTAPAEATPPGAPTARQATTPDPAGATPPSSDLPGWLFEEDATSDEPEAEGAPPASTSEEVATGAAAPVAPAADPTPAEPETDTDLSAATEAAESATDAPEPGGEAPPSSDGAPSDELTPAGASAEALDAAEPAEAGGRAHQAAATAALAAAAAVPDEDADAAMEPGQTEPATDRPDAQLASESAPEEPGPQGPATTDLAAADEDEASDPETAQAEPPTEPTAALAAEPTPTPGDDDEPPTDQPEGEPPTDQPEGKPPAATLATEPTLAPGDDDEPLADQPEGEPTAATLATEPTPAPGDDDEPPADQPEGEPTAATLAGGAAPAAHPEPDTERAEAEPIVVPPATERTEALAGVDQADELPATAPVETPSPGEQAGALPATEAAEAVPPPQQEPAAVEQGGLPPATEQGAEAAEAELSEGSARDGQRAGAAAATTAASGSRARWGGGRTAAGGARRRTLGVAERQGLMAAVVLVVLLVVGLVVWQLGSGGDGDDGRPDAGRNEVSGQQSSTTAPSTTAADDDSGDDRGGRSDEEDETTTTAAEATTTTAAQPAEPGVPADWVEYTNPEVGYTIFHPPGWQVVPSGRMVDIEEPGTGSYLRIDWTAQPQPDPVADWQTQAQSFSARHEAYQQIRIEPFEYRDYNAAIWEFTYRDGGADLHAANLGFVVRPDRAFALFFQTHSDRWTGSQELFAQFRASFRPT